MAGPLFRAWRFEHPDFPRGVETGGLVVAPTGGIDLVEGEASVRQALLLLLTTSPGERVMRPDYGCELGRLVFSPNDATTAGLAIHYVRRAIERWEPRIEVTRLDAGSDPEDPGWLSIDLTYRVRSTQQTRDLRLSMNVAGG